MRPVSARRPSKKSSSRVLNQWTHDDLITVRMLGLLHPEFSSLSFRNSELWEQGTASQQGISVWHSRRRQALGNLTASAHQLAKTEVDWRALKRFQTSKHYGDTDVYPGR